MFMLGDDISIFALKHFSPSAYLPGPHFSEKRQVLLDGTVSVRAFFAGLGKRAARGAYLVGGKIAHERLAVCYKFFGVIIYRLEIV